MWLNATTVKQRWRYQQWESLGGPSNDTILCERDQHVEWLGGQSHEWPPQGHSGFSSGYS